MTGVRIYLTNQMISWWITLSTRTPAGIRPARTPHWSYCVYASRPGFDLGSTPGHAITALCHPKNRRPRLLNLARRLNRILDRYEHPALGSKIHPRHFATKYPNRGNYLLKQLWSRRVRKPHFPSRIRPHYIPAEASRPKPSKVEDPKGHPRQPACRLERM